MIGIPTTLYNSNNMKYINTSDKSQSNNNQNTYSQPKVWESKNQKKNLPDILNTALRPTTARLQVTIILGLPRLTLRFDLKFVFALSCGPCCNLCLNGLTAVSVALSIFNCFHCRNDLYLSSSLMFVPNVFNKQYTKY